MLRIFKNNFHRTLAEHIPDAVLIAVTILLTIFFAVYITGKEHMKVNVAFISPNSTVNQS